MRISHVDHVHRFCDFLRAVQVRVDRFEGAAVMASVPGASSTLHERREIIGYITTWNALNPGALVELTEEADSG